MKNEISIRVGLEVHCQLNYVQTKLFCFCSTRFENLEPNINSCSICRGLPGSLPNLNGEAVKKALTLSKALEMTPVSEISFSRKHYFYPDLPKGFQITQTDGLIGTNGRLTIGKRKVLIKQIQLEEDPAKIIYRQNETTIDYNRSGVPLIECVTDPIFHTEKEILTFLKEYRRLLRILEISDTKKSSAFRVDLNISIETHPRVEVKNIGSDEELISAFHYEIKRQLSLLGEKELSMETRHWNQKAGVTTVSRSKEEAMDYMYMPEHDIPTVLIPVNIYQEILLPELPWETRSRLEEYELLSLKEIEVLLEDPELLKAYDKLLSFFSSLPAISHKFFWRDYVRWIKSPKKPFRERITGINYSELKPLFHHLEKDKISWNRFSKIIKEFVTHNKSLLEFKVKEEDQKEFIDVLKKLEYKFPEEWRKSFDNPKLVNFLVGQGVKLSKGTIKPKELYYLLIRRKNSI